MLFLWPSMVTRQWQSSNLQPTEQQPWITSPKEVKLIPKNYFSHLLSHLTKLCARFMNSAHDLVKWLNKIEKNMFVFMFFLKKFYTSKQNELEIKNYVPTLRLHMTKVAGKIDVTSSTVGLTLYYFDQHYNFDGLELPSLPTTQCWRLFCSIWPLSWILTFDGSLLKLDTTLSSTETSCGLSDSFHGSWTRVLYMYHDSRPPATVGKW